MAVDEHVHGQHAHHLGHDEGERAEVEGPAVGVGVLTVTLTGVARVSGYVHDDADDITEAWGGGARQQPGVKSLEDTYLPHNLPLATTIMTQATAGRACEMSRLCGTYSPGAVGYVCRGKAGG